MAQFISGHFFLPFAMTCLIPGILLTPLLARKTEIRLLPFMIRVAICGIGAEICIAFLASITAWMPYAAHARIMVISLIAIAGLAWIVYRGKWADMSVRITVYDGTAIGILLVMLLILRGRFGELVTPYFNAASDQYYWLAYAEASLHDATFTLAKIFTSAVHRPIFFLVLAPYAAFFPKDPEVWQRFMIVWTYGMHALSGIAIAEFAYVSLSRKMLGLLAAPMLFSFHWIDYYIISGNVAPQSMAIFLFIAGFALWHERKELRTIWAFLALSYAIHLGTLVIFGLIVGITTIIRKGVAITLRKTENQGTPWHIFEQIFLLPTGIVAILYALYASRILGYFDSSLIAYDAQYNQNLTLFSQPYLGREQEIILWAAIAGMVITAAFKRKNLPIAAGFATPWVLLITPLVAYHAFYASWQSFRYYLFLYPSAIILALLVIEWCADAIEWIASRRIGKGFVFIVVVGLLPIFASAAAGQERMVFMDMIQGRDGGAQATIRRNEMAELIAIARLLSPESVGPVVISPEHAATTIAQWAFAPRDTIVTDAICEETKCLSRTILMPKIKDLFSLEPAAIIIAKEGENGTISEKILDDFPIWKESDSFRIYMER